MPRQIGTGRDPDGDSAMDNRNGASLEDDRTLVEVMASAGESLAVIEDYLLCLDLTEPERAELARAARAEIGEAGSRAPAAPDIASGDALEMNPLTSQPQRSKLR